MVQSIMASGKITKCTVKVNSNGPMEEHIRETTQMTKNMGRESIRGLMDECIRVDFIMENNMVKGSIDKPLAKKFTVYGKKERKAISVRITMNF